MNINNLKGYYSGVTNELNLVNDIIPTDLNEKPCIQNLIHISKRKEILSRADYYNCRMRDSKQIKEFYVPFFNSTVLSCTISLKVFCSCEINNVRVRAESQKQKASTAAIVPMSPDESCRRQLSDVFIWKI